jgi:hypothetical protein
VDNSLARVWETIDPGFLENTIPNLNYFIKVNRFFKRTKIYISGNGTNVNIMAGMLVFDAPANPILPFMADQGVCISLFTGNANMGNVLLAPWANAASGRQECRYYGPSFTYSYNYCVITIDYSGNY